MNLRSILTLLLALTFTCSATALAKAKVLYESKNSFGSKYVYEENGQLCLSFLKLPTRINQSCIYSQRPSKLIFDYTKMVLAPLFINPNPQKILVMGLGGGSIPRALNRLLPNTYIDVVEIDPEIHAIAEKFFQFKQSENTKIHIIDGFEFVKNSKPDNYDIVIIDAFTDDYVPKSFLTPEFVGSIHRILTQNGIVAVNTFGIRNRNYKLESKLYKQVFGEFINLNSVSRVIIASKSKLPEKFIISKNAETWRNSFRYIDVSTDWLVGKF